MKAKTFPGQGSVTAKYVDWWPPLLVVAFLLITWLAVLKRGSDDDARVVENAFLQHGSVASVVANHTEQILDRLRFYGQTLASSAQNDLASTLVHSAVMRDSAFLRLMYFDQNGAIRYSTGRKAEPWLLESAAEFAATNNPHGEETIIVGTTTRNDLAPSWSLPIIYRPPVTSAGRDGFVVALIDLGHFPRYFEAISLGRSGEIVIVADDGRELLHMYEGRLENARLIGSSERFRRAFSNDAGKVAERVNKVDERLYAFRRISTSPLAVLVSRSKYDVLIESHAVQREYFGTQFLVTVLMLVFTSSWMIIARRRRQLVDLLLSTQANNARLIDQIGDEKQEAYWLATHDKLTGLANRMLFAEVATRYVSRARRQRKRFAVMFIDLDRFKPINDTYGHKVGDQVLIEISRRLQGCIRQTDVVSRFGGDEFVALVSDLRSDQDASAIADKIIESLSQPMAGIVEADIRVSPSIGISFYPDDADTIDSLVRQSDLAMYQAKESGRATYAFSDPALNRRNWLINQIEAALPIALINNEIHVHYQPKVSLGDYRIAGLEALARWSHPQMGDVSPADFIPVAEECNAIVELGEYVIAAVCRQLEAWLLAGIPCVPVAVNVSAHQLRSPRLYDFIVGTLEDHGVSPGLLEIEITETGLIDATEFIDTLCRLDELGIRLAIDDFGTGYSGLSHLRTLPVKSLKIDRSFVKDIRNDCSDAAIVSNTISLAHKLNLLTIAEGVETREQVSHLKAARCDQAQGYFFSRPGDAAAIEALLIQRCIDKEINNDIGHCETHDQ